MNVTSGRRSRLGAIITVATLSGPVLAAGNAAVADDIGKDVRVVNTATQAVPVGVAAPSMPVQDRANVSLSHRQRSTEQLFKVPDGKVLVLEHVSAGGIELTGTTLEAAVEFRETTGGIERLRHRFSLPMLRQASGGTAILTGSAELTAYAEPGQDVQMSVPASQSTNASVECEASAS